jgi:hypothetical protein
VDARLLAEVAEGVIALEPDGRALEARFFSGLLVEDFYLESFPLRVSEVHPEEHLGPVLGFGPAGARVDRQDGVSGVVLVVEQRPELSFLQGLLEPADPGLGFRFDVFALGGELRQDLELFFLAKDLPEELDVLFEEFFLRLEGLGDLLVLPDLRRGQARVYRFPLGVLVIEVKENPGPLRLSRKGR